MGSNVHLLNPGERRRNIGRDCYRWGHSRLSFGNVHSSELFSPTFMTVSLKSFIASLCSLTQISVSLAKDEPDTNLVALMKEEGVKLLREAVGIYISTLKTGIL